MNEVVLVHEFRAGTLECAHSGHISIVNEKGDVVYFAGDPDFVAFTRSSAKPFQAIPGIRAGLIDHYHLKGEDVAIMTASHRSQEVHVQTLERLSGKIDIEEHCLVCAPSLPLDETAREELLRANGYRRRLFHNCSGKHFGVLAYCKMAGYPLQGYDQPEHPVQQEILTTLAVLAELPRESIGLGTDGCGFPVFALPLSSLAKAYLKLACPDQIQDTATREAVVQITAAMNAHPVLVGGSGRVDSILLQDTNIVAKGGFKGVYCFSLKKERLGVALKILDGSEEEWGLVVLRTLEQLDYNNQVTLERLRSAFDTGIYNDAGKKVGYAEADFELSASR
ncbi:asparaginase [Paenibacillus sp. YPG26]|uniref:asparaginase n=1 Tax=Paenibacillus sp. YPG26 TaxID=2878915 RepID=UPI00203B173E|nr:asparaginase [Paenibacillus sp. YPG26]USB32613.1 asparaginase [Paenibacillus sp. YPG26]